MDSHSDTEVMDVQAALETLDGQIEALLPEEIPAAPPEEKKRRGRPRKKDVDQPPVVEPAVPPELIGMYGNAGANIMAVAFRVSGRFFGGTVELWELSNEEKTALNEALGPVLALHHDTLGKGMPYIYPAAVIYEMFARRYETAKKQVAEATRGEE